MKIVSHQIKGKGRGKFLGFPTINLEIPEKLTIEEGIYASWVKINNQNYMGALFFGPIPTFNETEKSLEVFLIDKTDLPDELIDNIEIGIKNWIREVKKFATEHDLVEQMKKDLEDVKRILKPIS